MSLNRFKRIALYAVAGSGLLLALVALLLVVEQRRTQAETGAVLAAFFSQEVLRDMDQWDVGRIITIAVMRNPDCAASINGTPSVASKLVDDSPGKSPLWRLNPLLR